MIINFYNLKVWDKIRFNFSFGDVYWIVVFVVN